MSTKSCPFNQVAGKLLKQNRIITGGSAHPDSRRVSAAATRLGGCFSAKTSRTDLDKVPPLLSTPQGIWESNDKTPPLVSSESNLRAADTLPDDMRQSKI